MPLNKEELSRGLYNKPPQQTHREPEVPDLTAKPQSKVDLFDFEPSFDYVPLPSKGILYPEEHPFHNKERVEIKAMTSYEENILHSEAFLKKGTVLNELLSSCLVDKSVDPSSLLLGDKGALLLAVRISGFGPEYRVMVTCPDCDYEFKHEFDLSQVVLKGLGEEAKQVEHGKNLFEFTLPMSKAVVQFSLLTDAEDAEIQKTQDQRLKAMGKLGKIPELDTTITDRLLKSIKKITNSKGAEITDKASISKVLTKMLARDSSALRHHIAKIQPDTDMSEAVTCPNPKCGVEDEYTIPLTTEFFWPTGD